MPKITKAMLEERNKILKNDLIEAESKNARLHKNNIHLNYIIDKQRTAMDGMASTTQNSGQAIDALSHAIRYITGRK